MQVAHQAAEQRDIGRYRRVVFVRLTFMAVPVIARYRNRLLIMPMLRIPAPLVRVGKGRRQNPPGHHQG